MHYYVRLSPEIRSEMTRLSLFLKQKIKDSLKELQNDFFLGKPLIDELEGFRSYPVSHHRIIYTIEGGKREIAVAMIAPRFEVYELLLGKKARA